MQSQYATQGSVTMAINQKQVANVNKRSQTFSIQKFVFVTDIVYCQMDGLGGAIECLFKIVEI